MIDGTKTGRQDIRQGMRGSKGVRESGDHGYSQRQTVHVMLESPSWYLS